MATVRPILIWPDDTLKHVSVQVTLEEQQSEAFAKLLEDMFATMYAHRGVGLAAIQIGVAMRVFVMDDSGDKQSNPKVFVNPVGLESLGSEQLVEEGCLSLPGVREQVLRHQGVVVVHRDRGGNERFVELWGLESQCAQHEIEHLDGHTLADGYGPVKRDQARRKIRKTLRHRKD